MASEVYDQDAKEEVKDPTMFIVRIEAGQTDTYDPAFKYANVIKLPADVPTVDIVNTILRFHDLCEEIRAEQDDDSDSSNFEVLDK